MTAAARTTLLTEEEIQAVLTNGPTPWPGRDLVVDAADDALVLTLKGHQYYRLALQQHGVTTPLRDVRTRTALNVLSSAARAHLRQQLREQLARSLQAGEVPLQLQELVRARLHGGHLRQKQALNRLVRNIQTGSAEALSQQRDRPAY